MKATTQIHCIFSETNSRLNKSIKVELVYRNLRLSLLYRARWINIRKEEKMKKILLTLIVLSAFAGAGRTQETLQDFKQRIQDYYHVIGKPEIKNFTCQLSADFYINFIREYADSSYYYPLKFIWTADKGSYFIRHPLPEAIAQNDSLRRQALMRMLELKSYFKVVFPDWEIYSIRPPLWDIPENAVAQFGPDTVGISFREGDPALSFRVKETYTRGGLLARFIWESDSQKVVNLPVYDEIAGKWVCIGWKNQVYQGDFISSGMAVQMALGLQEQIIVPSEFRINAQAKKSPGGEVIPSALVLYLKDYSFNENIEIVEEPPGEEPSPAPKP